ncbi:MAG: hypothetical protein ACRCYS_13825 [Beijerinckiaceae bacterium]
MTEASGPFAHFGKSCRHWRPIDSLRSEKGCAIGHPIEKIVHAANGNSSFGIAFMFPCRPGPHRKAECPNYDAKTDAEIAEEKAAMRSRMDAFVKAMPVMSAVRATMVAGKIARQVIDCPWCNMPNALHVSCAVDLNNHLAAQCKSCGEGFIE